MASSAPFQSLMMKGGISSFKSTSGTDELRSMLDWSQLRSQGCKNCVQFPSRSGSDNKSQTGTTLSEV